MSSLAAKLRVFARIDDPSTELYEYLAVKEKVASPLECWVDLATPRDFEWSDEIREKAVEFGVADETGEILATFTTMAAAEEARGKAKIKLALSFNDDEPENPRGAPAPVEPLVTETDSQTGQTSIVSAAAGL